MARDIGKLKSNLMNNMKGEQAYYVQDVGELRCPNFFRSMASIHGHGHYGTRHGMQAS